MDMMRKNVQSRLVDFMKDKEELERNLRVGYKGTTYAGGFITLLLAITTFVTLMSRVSFIYASKEHAYEVRESFFTTE